MTGLLGVDFGWHAAGGCRHALRRSHVCPALLPHPHDPGDRWPVPTGGNDWLTARQGRHADRQRTPTGTRQCAGDRLFHRCDCRGGNATAVGCFGESDGPGSGRGHPARVAMAAAAAGQSRLAHRPLPGGLNAVLAQPPGQP